MKKVITARDVQEILKNGGDTSSLPSNAIYTPSARDLLRGKPQPKASNASIKGGTSGGNNIDRFFNSPENQKLKEEICDIGRRLWTREYVDGNGGNISIRVGENMALCTPTLVSKGFMKPEDICLVDLDGNQLAGKRKRTSEILMHLEVMKAQPRAKSCVHCHPPYATAFAAAGVQPPNRILPEFEVFIGEVPIAQYDTPGTRDMGVKVAELANDHNTILMANHGVVSWSDGVEDAYFKMEIIEAYCRTIMVAGQLGKEVNLIAPDKVVDLMNIKSQLGIPDRRIGLKEADLNDIVEWRPGVVCVSDQPCSCSGTPISSTPSPRDDDAEQIVQLVTDMIMNHIQ